ncbi:MAG: 50S ribosomal protein L3 [Dehalococcoidia bacterium]
MVAGLLGKKLGMTQLYKEGNEVVVTAIEAGPCFVVQVKTEEKDGYNAVQLGFGDTKRLNSPQKGHQKDVGQFKYLREFSLDKGDAVEKGSKVDFDIFKTGDLIDVTGVSKKGKGFAGGVKRYHFKGGPKTHGQSDRHRAPGSIGSGSTPGRVIKGLRMAGHMGNERVTVKNLQVVDVDLENHLLLVKGAVPGFNKGLVMIKKAGEV